MRSVVDIFAVDALVLLTYEIAQGEFRAKNSTKPNEYLVQAVWQNCPARNTIHSAMWLVLVLNFLAQAFKVCFARPRTEPKNSTASLKNSTDASAGSARFSNYVHVRFIFACCHVDLFCTFSYWNILAKRCGQVWAKKNGMCAGETRRALRVCLLLPKNKTDFGDLQKLKTLRFIFLRDHGECRVGVTGDFFCACHLWWKGDAPDHDERTYFYISFLFS